MSAVFAAVVIACSIYVIHDNGGFYSGPSLLGSVLAQPWISIIYSFFGNQMSYPEKLNSAIDDDQMSKIGMAAEAFSGMFNAFIIYGVSRFFKKTN